MTDARTTQASVEQWAVPNPQAQATQVALEMWARNAVVLGQAIVTQIGLEQWARVVPDVPPMTGGQTAVCMNMG